MRKRISPARELSQQISYFFFAYFSALAQESN